MAPRAQRLSGLPVRFVVPPLGASRLRMASPYTWGSCNRATRGYSRPPRQAGSFPNAFTGRRLHCLKHWYSQPRFGRVSVWFLIVDLPPLVKDAGGPSTTSRARQQQKSGRNVHLGERRPRKSGSHQTCMELSLSSGGFGFCSPFFARSGKGRSSSRRLRSGSRSARKGSRDRSASAAWRRAALASLVFRSALTPEHAEGR
jgi:hypothetical protein